MSSPVLAILINHLWQSTLFVAAIWGLTLLLRRNTPRVRYSLWLAASLKFLLPFALLAAIGAEIPWNPEASKPDSVTPQIARMAGNLTAPMAGELPYPGHSGATFRESPESVQVMFLVTISALVVWFTGALFVMVRWFLRWLEIRLALRKSVLITGVDFPAPVRVTQKQFEPGVVGVFRPTLLLPTGIEERLTPEQMRAVLAHERCHLRWRDNLTASLHMLVEAVFWFFPPVWWIGARLIEERERACDEQVVREGHTPESYAEGILNVCEHYIKSRLPCVSGISGADLRKRIESIVRRTPGMKLDGPKKLVLAAIACCAVAAPIAAGMLSGNSLQVLFSLDPRSTALLEYLRVGRASVDISQLYGSEKNYLTLCPLPGAALTSKQKTLAALVAKLSPEDDKALLYAVAANSMSEVRRLLAGGAKRTGDGWLRPSSLMHNAVTFADTRMLELLRNEGFSIDEVSTDGIGTGDTPLMRALSEGRLENARWLIEHGADVSFANKYGNSALVSALVVCRDHNQAALLLKAGVKPNFKALRIADNLGVDLRTEVEVANHLPGPPLQSWRTPPKEADVTADLDGDEAPDHAALLSSTDGAWEGVFVKLSSRDPDQWIKAADFMIKDPNAPKAGISELKPGTYGKPCTNGPGTPCADGISTALTLKNSGIRFAMPSGVNCAVHWDTADQKLKCVRINR